MAGTVFSGSYATGVVLDDPSQNPVTVAAGGVIDAAAGSGITGFYVYPWTIENFGTVAGGAEASGIALLDGGSVANSGAIGGVIWGVYIGGGDGTVTNTGAITASGGVGVGINDGGAVYNDAGATIAGTVAGVVEIRPAGLVNAGVIIGSGSTYAFGVEMDEGGGLLNAAGGTISGYAAGLVVDAAAGLNNVGLIEATATNGIGVNLDGQGITLFNHGAIEGRYGILTGVRATVVNAGTIAGEDGGAAVLLGTAGDLLVVEPGAVFVGAVDSGGLDSLELDTGSGVGTLTGIGDQFFGFARLEVHTGADWVVAGDAPRLTNDGTLMVDASLTLSAGVDADAGDSGVIDAGSGGTVAFEAKVADSQSFVFEGHGGNLLIDRPMQFRATIDGFAAGDTIDLVGIAATHVALHGDTLTVSDHGATVAKLQFASPPALGFSLSPDGNGGTDITLAKATAAEWWALKG